jgi:hypothetical protein
VPPPAAPHTRRHREPGAEPRTHQGDFAGQLRPPTLAKLAKERPKKPLSMTAKNIGDRKRRERIKAEQAGTHVKA